MARPVGLAWAKDGSLLMADDANGVIYRVAYEGREKTAAAMEPPADEMKRQAQRGIGAPLAKDRSETDARDATSATSAKSAASVASIALTSTAFGPDAAIPRKHSEYADGVSPPLRWSPVPGAKSYVLLAEDPDSKPITPFVHWVAWNIPPEVTSLPEGLQEQERLTEPAGLMQGATSRGSVGYYGPRPPVGDPPHHYHFQIFALDTLLQLPLGATRDDVLKAATGHVIGKGELVGTYRQEVKPPK